MAKKSFTNSPTLSLPSNPALAFMSAAQKETHAPGSEAVVDISLAALHNFKNHPFSVVDDEEMQRMAQSVRERGVLTPATVRPREAGGYELISGHRRKRASELAGKETMPCIVREMNDDDAIVFMVDSNQQRENVRLSEKAFALKMKLEAIKRQGERVDLTSRQVGEKSVSVVAREAGESERQTQRLIRLTELVPELLEKVDNKKMPLTVAVELSYLPAAGQGSLAQLGRIPSLAQAQQIKKLSQDGKLDTKVLNGIFEKPKPREKREITLKGRRLERFYTNDYTPMQFEDVVYRALEAYFANPSEP